MTLGPSIFASEQTNGDYFLSNQADATFLNVPRILNALEETPDWLVYCNMWRVMITQGRTMEVFLLRQSLAD